MFIQYVILEVRNYDIGLPGKMARRLSSIVAVCLDRLVFEINTRNLNVITSVKSWSERAEPLKS